MRFLCILCNAGPVQRSVFLGCKQILHSIWSTDPFIPPYQRDSDVLDEIQEEYEVRHSYSQAESRIYGSHFCRNHIDHTSWSELVDDCNPRIHFIYRNEYRGKASIQKITDVK